MITFDGIELNPSLQWVNRDQSLRVAQTVRYTRGGMAKIYQQPLFSGIPILLEANEETGWFTNSMREDLLLRADMVGVMFPFFYFGTEYTVIFNHSDPPAVSFTKIIYRQVPDSSDYFMGTVSLITV